MCKRFTALLFTLLPLLLLIIITTGCSNQSDKSWSAGKDWPVYLGDDVSDILSRTRTGILFNPPSEQGTLIFPGSDVGGKMGNKSGDQYIAFTLIDKE